MRKLAIALSLSMAAFGQTTFNSSGGLTVAAPTANLCPSGIGSSTVTASGLSGTIASVSVNINGITSNRIGAINFQLESPGGQKMVIWRAIGSNTVAIPSTNVTLTDTAAIPLPTFNSTPNTVTSGASYQPAAYALRTFVIPPDEGASPTFSGCTTPPTYASAAPVGTATLGNTFNGLSPNGAWKLNMIHNGGTAAGSISISSWGITITTNAAAATSTTLISATNPSLTGSSVNFTATVTSSGSPVTTGTVTFTQGATTLAANVPVNGSGQATAGVSFSTEGLRTITATYNGTPSFGSSNGSVHQEVNNPTTLVSGRYCNTGVLTLPGSVATITPAVPYPSKIFLSSVAGAITSVKLYLNGYNHTRPLAVNLLLVSPDGRKFVPMSTVGGVNPAGPVDMILSDAGSAFISTTALAAGTFLPTAVNNFDVINFPSPAPAPPYQFAQSFGTATFASTFAGATPLTTWQLFAVTQGANTSGAFNGGWCIEPSVNSDAPTVTSVSGTPNNSFTVAPNAQVTITAHVQRVSNGAPATAGTVNFTQGLTVLGSAPVNANGDATITQTFTTEGDLPIVASYSGVAGTFGPSSGSYTQIVVARTTQSGISFCNPGGISIIQPPSITDTASPYPSRIIVPAGTGTVRKLTVSLNGLTHAASNQLDMLLVGPAAQNLVFLASAGGSGAVTSANLVFDDAAALAVPQSSTISSGTFRPSSYNAAASFLPPAPAGPYNHAASAGSSTLALFNNTASNGTWQLFVRDKTVGSLGTIGSWCVNVDTYPDLVIAKSHTGNFTQGQTGAQFTITVSNTTVGATSGAVTVTETVPAGLTLTGLSGSGWTCASGGNTCTRSDALAGNSSYPPITATFNVAANAAASITNNVSVSGGGELNTSNNGASDTVTVNAGTVALTINTNPAGRTFTLNGTPYTSPQTFNVPANSTQNLATTSPQAGGAGTQFVFSSWSDGGPISHPVSISGPTTITGNFITQHLLTTAVNNIGTGSGTVSPATGFQNAGLVNVTATPSACSVFAGWSGATVTAGQVDLTGPLSLTASFSAPTAAPAIKGSLQTIRGTPQRYRQTVSVLNNTGATADISIILDTFGGGVSVSAPAAPTGLTTGCTGGAGRAFYTVSNVAAGAYGTVTFDFNAPSAGAVSYNASAVIGAGPR